MNLLVPLFLLVPLVIQLSDQYLHLEPRHDHVYPVHHHTPHPVYHYDHFQLVPQQYQMMTQKTPLTGDYSHLDHKAPLSNKDLGILLLDYCNTKANTERELTDAKLETAIKGLCDEIVKLRKETRQQALEHTRQVEDI